MQSLVLARLQGDTRTKRVLAGALLKRLVVNTLFGGYHDTGDSMKRFLILAIVLLAGLPALVQSRSATVSPPLVANEVRRNFTLEQTAFARTHRLKSLLQPGVRAKL